MKMAPLFGQKIVDGGAALFVLFRADKTPRLVEGKIDFALRADGFAVH